MIPLSRYARPLLALRKTMDAIIRAEEELSKAALWGDDVQRVDAKEALAMLARMRRALREPIALAPETIRERE